jgi:hypothetical protein
MTLAETYQNRFTNPPNQVCQRYWVHPMILVGGNVNDGNELIRLRQKFGICGFINLDHNRPNDLTGIENDWESFFEDCLDQPVLDNGEGFNPEDVRRVISFAYGFKGYPIHLNCHIGYSRSPAFAYAIMRWVYGMQCGEATRALNESGGPFGSSYLNAAPKHRTYLFSIERAWPTMTLPGF